MICNTKADKKDLVLITIDDAPTMSYLLGNVALEAYLPSYPVDDGTFGVYPEMYRIHTWESLESQSMEVSKAGVVMGIAPLLMKDDAEEGTSGEVKFFYQMLLDDGTLCLVRSFATRGNLLGIYPDGSYISDPQHSRIPGWVAWVKGKRTVPKPVKAPAKSIPLPPGTPAVGSLLRFRTWQELLDDPDVTMNPNGKLFVPADGNFQFACGPSGFYVHEQWELLGATHTVAGVSAKGSIRLEDVKGWWNHISKLFTTTKLDEVP